MALTTVVQLMKTVTVKSDGVVITYRLKKGACSPAILLSKTPTPEQITKIQEILK